MTLVEWFRELTPDEVLLFALPFLVAAIAVIVDGIRWRRWRPDGMRP